MEEISGIFLINLMSCISAIYRKKNHIKLTLIPSYTLTTSTNILYTYTQHDDWINEEQTKI